MFCKILNNNSVLDVIESPTYIYYLNGIVPQKCSRGRASAVYSSDYEKIWHIEGWGKHPSFANELCRFVEITQEEYEMLKEALEKEQAPTASVENPNDIVIESDKITLQTMRDYKVNKMREFCSAAIIDGVTVTFPNGEKEHFDLEIEDQINLFSLQELIGQGIKTVPYHATGKGCRLYTAEEAKLILASVTEHRIWHTTYFNSLKNYILNLDSIATINELYYGVEIPEEYQTEALKSLLK